ncbi:metalloendopeptidase [Plakobranchus ocellatus]|uniref:Metalloendopeptidase n=1 Tax=Plakobranchus ocellatus TaxID=259542 RepID=A0AAV3YGT2_9GAST|nr:metalloendopeptidase [Plakobranchus ocellatus]
MGLMKRLIQMSLFFTIAYVVESKPHSKGKKMSIDKQIMDAAGNAQHFDVFHVMPEGDIKVMTEYDILLSLEDYKKLRGSPKSKGNKGKAKGKDKEKNSRWRSRGRNSRRRQKRKADQDIAKLWPNCEVFYEVDEGFTDEDVIELNAAIAEWQEYTCLRFTESYTETSRLQFRNGAGCYSQLGRQLEPQIVALAPTCRTKGIIAHEIGHAIGWYHEHMRHDRDNYIAINFDAIPTRYQINFHKYSEEMINTHGVEYDYTSLMHYGNDALPGSITALDPFFQDKMGQREGLSFKDIKLANIMYDCADFMGCPYKECPFNGFQLYKSYKSASACKCWCDSGNITDPLVLCSEIDSAPVGPSIRPTETPVIDLCYDVRNDCEDSKSKGYCMSRLDLMMDVCKKTCGFCDSDSEGGPAPCMDHDKGCPMMAATGLCTALEPVMSIQCPGSCDLCPAPPDPCKIQQEVMVKFHDIPTGGSRNRAPFISSTNFAGVVTGGVISVFATIWRRLG